MQSPDDGHWSPEEQAEHERLHPPLPGNKDHHCTDVLWLLAFLVAVLGMAYATAFAQKHGDHRKLTRGFNLEGQLCGFDVSPSFLFYCKEPTGQELRTGYPMCIDSCPTNTASSNSSRLCPAAEGRTLLLPDYDTMSFAHWCLPVDGDLLSDELHSFGNTTVDQAFMAIRDIRSAGAIVFTAAGVVAIVLGYVYLYLLDKCAECLVYVCETVLVLGALGGGGVLLFAGSAGSLGFHSTLQGTGDPHLDLSIGAGLLALSMVMFCVFCVQNKSLGTAVGCIQAACECMMEEPSLLLEPCLSLINKVFWLALLINGLVGLMTAGKVIRVGTSGVARKFEWTTEEEVLMAYWIFMTFWIIEMCSAMSQYALAWTTQRWYFTPYVNGHKDDKQPCSLVMGYCNALRYHLGTIAFGSLLITYLRLVRLGLAFLARMAQAEGNAIGACIAKCCLCAVTCFQRFLEFLNKSAYMDVAITSSNFCTAAGRAMELLTSEVPAVAVLNGTQFIFQISGVGLVACLTYFLALTALESLEMFSSPHSGTYVSHPGTMAVLASIWAGFIALSFMHVFDMVGDTILYCFASEQRRHSRVDRKLYGEHREKPSGLFSWLFGGGEESSEEERVDYAPRKLKEIIQKQNAALRR